MFKVLGLMNNDVMSLAPSADFPNEIYKIQAAVIIEETVSPKLVGQFVVRYPTF